MGERKAKRARFAEDVSSGEEAEEDGVDGNSALTFRLLAPGIEAASRMTESAHFHPEMCHQVFGDSERITGWDDVPHFGVDVWLSQTSGAALVEVRPEGRVRLAGATDVVAALAEWFPGLTTDRASFQAAASEPLQLEQLGLPVHRVSPVAAASSSSSSSATVSGDIVIYRTALAGASNYVKGLHSRLQPLGIFFIDAFNYLEDEKGAVDPRWEMFLAVHESPTGPIIVGQARSFNFFGWPDKSRIRLSQILVLPAHQAQGVGRALLEAVYRTALERDALDVTVEDPAPALRRLRDRLDLHMMAATPCLLAAAAQVAEALNGKQTAASSTDGALAAALAAAPEMQLAPELAARARTQLKISIPQIRLLWEVLLYRQKGIGDTDTGQAALAALISKRVKSSITEPRRTVQHKRFLQRFEDEKEVGFAMLRLAPGSRLGDPPALEDSEGPSDEDLAQQVGKAVSERLTETAELAAWLNSHL